MRAALAMTFLAGLLVCAGCFTAAPPITTPPAPKVEDVRPAPPPVTPDSVNDGNYRERAQALADELDREQQRNLLKTPRE
jgi:hypothetical protein